MILDLAQTTPRVDCDSVSFDKPFSDKAESNSPLALFKCRRVSLNQLLDDETSINEFRRYVRGKNVFMVGMTNDLMESETVDRFI